MAQCTEETSIQCLTRLVPNSLVGVYWSLSLVHSVKAGIHPGLASNPSSYSLCLNMHFLDCWENQIEIINSTLKGP